MRAFLVTGGAGFIGSHLCDRLLAEGHRVVAVDNLSKGRISNLAEARAYGHPRFAFENVDIRHELKTLFEHHRPEVVMHLAAQSSVRASLEDPIHDAMVNLIGLLNVLEAAVATGARKVVFASSGGTIYGEARNLPVKETARRSSHPESPYGVSKKVAEEYLEFYRRRYSLDYTSLALANVYGPRQDPFGESGVISIFSLQMLKGETPTIFGDGDQTRDYVYVDDVVHAFALAADRASGGLINIGTGVEVSVTYLYAELAKITGFRGDPRFASARAGEVQRSALYLEMADNQLGWAPWTPLQDGLQLTVDWVREP